MLRILSSSKMIAAIIAFKVVQNIPEIQVLTTNIEYTAVTKTNTEIHLTVNNI